MDQTLETYRWLNRAVNGRADTIADRIYENYDSDAKLSKRKAATLSLRKQRRRRLVRKYFPIRRDARVLDMGCGGDGLLLGVCAELGYKNLTGIDKRPPSSAAAAIPVNFVVGDFKQILRDMPDESVEVVVAHDVFEHIESKADCLEVGEQIYRILSVSGRFILRTPNCGTPSGMMAQFVDWTHYQFFSAHSLKQLLDLCGFEDVESFEEAPDWRDGVVHAMRFALWNLLIRSTHQGRLWVEKGYLDQDAICSMNVITLAHKRGGR